MVKDCHQYHDMPCFLIVSGFFDCQSNTGRDHPEKIVSNFKIDVVAFIFFMWKRLMV